MRRGKNKYSWKGFGAMPKALKQLKVIGVKRIWIFIFVLHIRA